MTPQKFPKGCKDKAFDLSSEFLNVSFGVLATVMAMAIGIFAVLFLFFPESLGALYAEVANGFKDNLK